MSRHLSGLERNEIMNRTKAMSDEELQYTLKYIPTSMLLAEVSRREGIVIDRLADVCNIFNECTLDKSIDEMDILEKQELVKRLRRAMSVYEIYE